MKREEKTGVKSAALRRTSPEDLVAFLSPDTVSPELIDPETNNQVFQVFGFEVSMQNKWTADVLHFSWPVLHDGNSDGVPFHVIFSSILRTCRELDMKSFQPCLVSDDELQTKPDLSLVKTCEK